MGDLRQMSCGGCGTAAMTVEGKYSTGVLVALHLTCTGCPSLTVVRVSTVLRLDWGHDEQPGLLCVMNHPPRKGQTND